MHMGRLSRLLPLTDSGGDWCEGSSKVKIRSLALAGVMAVYALLMVGFAGAAGAVVQCGDGSTVPDGYQCPASSGQAATSNDNPAPGQQVVVSGSGFQPGTTVTVVLGNNLARTTATANAAGRFSARLTIPCDTPPGSQTITATGTGAGGGTRTLTTTVNVRDSKCIGGNLPRTGSSSAVPLTAAGAGLVVIGAGAVIIARRRRGVILED